MGFLIVHVFFKRSFLLQDLETETNDCQKTATSSDSSQTINTAETQTQQTREFRNKDHQKENSVPRSRDPSASSVSSNRSSSSSNSHPASVTNNAYSNNYPYYEYPNKRNDNRNCDAFKSGSRPHVNAGHGHGRGSYQPHSHSVAQGSKVYRRKKNSISRSGKDHNHNNQTVVSGR